jgi:hypothetical protein
MKLDYPNGVVFGDVIGQALPKRSDLRPSLTRNESRHDRRRHDLGEQRVMTLAGVCAQPGSKAVAHLMDTARNLPLTIY